LAEHLFPVGQDEGMAKGELLDKSRANNTVAILSALFAYIGRKLGRDFGRRLATALIAGPMVLVAVFSGGLLLNLVVAGVYLGCLVELYIMIRPDRASVRWLFFILGMLYLGAPFYLLSRIALRPDSAGWLIVLLLSNWATDGFALIGGRIWGRTKLAPAISPGKTVEGVLIGILAGIVVATGFSAVLLQLPVAAGIVVGLAIALPTVIGDLFESYVKRQFHVKDTGGVLPGHGGLLDRVDGLVLAVIGLSIILLLL